MIDLSFLTEEEQEAIMKVLQRDAELKRAEEERVRHLPEKVKDDVQLKNMSGQWFYEAKSKRHRDKIHGADIIRASMRRKPATLAEVSQNKSNKAKNSWVSNVNKEVFVPPELHGILEHQEEQQPQSCSSSKTIISMLDTPEERPTKAAVSPVKQRRNPFNFTASGDNLNSGESEHRPTILPQLSNKEILSPSKESQPKPNLGNDEEEKPKAPSVDPTDETQKGLVKRPVPKARKLIHKATAPLSQREDVPKPAKRTERINGIGTPPRGILKRSSSSSSTDSEVRVSQMLDVHKKNGVPTATIFEGEAEKNSLVEEVEDSTQISLEKLKQVRFSSGTGKGEPLQSPQLHHSREKGEFDLFESDETSTGNDALRTDTFGNKQTSAVKPLGTCSSALQVKTIDGLQNGSSASSPCDTNRSVLSVNETLQAKTVNPKKPETPQKTSNDILPNSSNKPRVETCESETNQFLSHESKPHESINDEHQLSAKTEVCDVPKTNYESLQQGKPHLVEEKHAKTTFKPDKHADELMKVADESVSRVLDWFKRSSGTEDRKHVSARSQGREPKEDVGFTTRTAGLPTQYSMDRKTEVKEELPFGKLEQQNSISSTSFISEDKQLIKERMEPKKGEENEGQSEKSLTGSVCTRVEEKQHCQEIMQPNKKSDLFVHQEHEVPAQKCESEKAIRARRRIKEIRAFWEGNKTFPSYGEKEVDTNASGGCGERDKIKPTAVYLPNGLDDQSKNTLRGAELSCTSQASRNKHQNSFEFGQGHAVQKPESTLLSDGKVQENTELPKASNLQPRVGPTSASPESEAKDEKETLKGKLAAISQQKPSFQVLSSKEKMNENSKDQVSDPSHFQSLRNFWDSGVKLQSNIDRVGVSVPKNTSSITYERKAKEDDKGRDKQELIQQQTQTLERETNQKPDSVCGLPLQSPALEGLNTIHTKNRESVQLGRKAVISKPQESVGLPEQEVKECVDKSVVSSKEHHVSFQLHQSPGNKDAFKEKAEDDCLCLSIEKVENKITPLEISLPKEEVAETVDKVVLPKAEFDVFRLGLKKLENEASEMSSSLNPKENILKGTTFHSDQCKVSERSIGQSHDTSPANGKEEMSENTGGVNVSSRDEHENKNSLRKLFREFEPFHLQFQPAEKDDNLWGSQRLQAGLSDLLRETFASQPSEYRRVAMKTSDDTNMSQMNSSVESTCQEDNGQREEVNETTEVSVVLPKVSGLSSALEKLMKEASETPPLKPKHADNTAQTVAEMQVKNMTYEHDGELPQEIRETVEKSIVPSKVSGFNSALEKLMEEASETPPPKPKRAVSMEQRAAEVEFKGTTFKHDEEFPQEIRDTVEKSVVPSKVNGLNSALEKLMKEASEMPPPKPKRAISTEQRAAEVEVKGTTFKHDGELLQEIRETVEKSIAPPKVNGLSSALEKLMKEAPDTLPPKPKHADSTMQRAAEMEIKSMTYEHDGEVPQEIRETVEKSIVPPKANGFNSALEKLMKEASETPPPKPKRAISTEQRAAEVEAKGTTFKHDGELLQEIRETVKKSVVPSKGSDLSSALEKLMKEASETPPPKPKRAISTEQRAAEGTTYEHDGELLQEIVETVERSVLSKADYGLLDANLQKLLKEASETPASELRNTNKQMQGKMQTSQSMHVPHQQERDHPQEIQERIEKTSNIEKFSEFSSSLEKLLQEASETSSPLSKELHKRIDSNFPRAEGAQLCLTSQCEDNEEEEGGGTHCGYKFSDENSDSYSGTGSSIRSEEELNPVLMALKRSADRKMPSKSLEDIPSATSNKRKINNPKEELALSAEDGPKPNQERNENAARISTVPSQPDKLSSNPDKLKGLSKSVPSFLQEESDDRETDTASESSYSLGRIKKSPSSLTNLSGSSGMASLSSVSGSLMSIYSADFGNVDVKGNIQFAIDYVEQLNELHVFICQCKDLAVADVKRQRSDPYVKTYLLPEKYKLGKRKTSVKKKTFNPVYNEILRYKIEKDLLKNQSLNISVWHNDTFGRNSFLGEVELDLGTWDWNDKSNKQINWFPLKPRTSTISFQPENRGEMKLALQYVPHPVGGKKTLSTGEVHIWVKECHDLPLLRGNRLNSFIKCTVLPDTSRKSRQKTRTVAKTTNPVFNHTMVYDGFRPGDLKEACVELTVWDHNKLANHFLGGLRIGLGTGKSYGTVVDWMDSTLAETALWEKMMNSPNMWVEDTLPLRMLMVAKLTK